MKKLIFTAIAMVAFSGVSMAGTLEESLVLEKLPIDKCCTVYDLAFNLAISEGAPPQTAENAANDAYNNCRSSSGPTLND
jgi:hypothetical protein